MRRLRGGGRRTRARARAPPGARRSTARARVAPPDRLVAGAPHVVEGRTASSHGVEGEPDPGRGDRTEGGDDGVGSRGSEGRRPGREVAERSGNTERLVPSDRTRVPED